MKGKIFSICSLVCELMAVYFFFFLVMYYSLIVYDHEVGVCVCSMQLLYCILCLHVKRDKRNSYNLQDK